MLLAARRARSSVLSTGGLHAAARTPALRALCATAGPEKAPAAASSQPGHKSAPQNTSEVHFRSAQRQGGDVREGTRSQVHFRRTPHLHPLEGTVFEKQRVPPPSPSSSAADHIVPDGEWVNPVAHPVWSKEEVENVEQTFVEPKGMSDTIAYRIVQCMRFSFDLLAGFKFGKITEDKWLNRMIFLETVAGVPGMLGGMSRHLRSLRGMKRDHGRIHTLLEEAENERMHLLTFLTIKQPGPLFRFCVVATQAVMSPTYFIAYTLFPQTCSRMVGYIETEAVRTYTHIIEDLRAGNLPEFEKLAAPPIAINYWALAPTASFEDVLLAVRKDEATHRDVNHTFAELGADEVNPYVAE